MNLCPVNIPAGLTPDEGEHALHRDDPSLLRLPADGARALDPVTTRVVRCVAGRVWVTQEGSPADVVLAAGELFVASRRGKVVVQALSDAPAGVWVA